MRLARVGPRGAERPVAIIGDTAFDVTHLTPDFDRQFWLDVGIEGIRKALGRDHAGLSAIDLSETRVGSPVPPPPKLVCVGLNYEDHIHEAAADVPMEPVIFMKAPNTVVGPNDDLIIPPGSRKTDYEIELAVIIGRTCRYLPDPTAGLAGIAGYAISNDVSERAHQLERGGQWVKGKSAESFNPLGPYLVTPDEIANPMDLDLSLRVNGDVRQDSNTSRMIFPPDYIVWYLSQFMTLEPGDVVNTGTPVGVGLGMNPPRYLRPGDLVELSIMGLGAQRQVCRQAIP